ncbi:hypothetical protein GS907_07275 [Rhodococcus hoagii]|nr:hypothetical protein [Prescottella equi]
MSRRPMTGDIQEAVRRHCLHPVQFGDGDTVCPVCKDIEDELIHLTIPHDVYGRPLRYREEASPRNIWTRFMLGFVWWLGTVIAYGEMAEALVDHWGWEGPSMFWIGGIVYAIVTFGLVMYGAQAREEAHMWEVEEW